MAARKTAAAVISVGRGILTGDFITPGLQSQYSHEAIKKLKKTLNLKEKKS